MERLPSLLFAAVLLAIVAAGAPAVGAAKGDTAKAACVGHAFEDVRRADGTPFKNPAECKKYVAAGGTLVPAPRMVIDVYYTDDDHCEFSVQLYGFLPSTLVPVSFVHPLDGMRMLEAQIGSDGTTSYAAGGIGVAFSLSLDSTVTVTAAYTGPGGPLYASQDLRC